MQTIKVAGTSFGGSSYMARLVRSYHPTGLTVEVSKGIKQREVADEIRRCVSDLSKFHNKPLNIEVIRL